MFREAKGFETVEYIIVGAVIVAVLGGTLYTLMNTMAAKLQAINVQIGS